MSRVRGKLFEGDNTGESLNRMNKFLEMDEIRYVDMKKISNCRLILIYRKKKQ